MRSSRRASPDRERARNRVFDFVVLPVLALVTIFLVWKAFTG